MNDRSLPSVHLVLPLLVLCACAAPRVERAAIPATRASEAPEPATAARPRASATLFRVILPVTGIDAAARFYARVLETPGVRVSGGRHYFDCGSTILACFDPRGDGDARDATPMPDWLYFAVDDLRAAHARCLAAGASPEPGEVGGPPAGEIAQRPWGELSFYVRDPFGNGICFVERGTMFTGSAGR